MGRTKTREFLTVQGGPKNNIPGIDTSGLSTHEEGGNRYQMLYSGGSLKEGARESKKTSLPGRLYKI